MSNRILGRVGGPLRSVRGRVGSHMIPKWPQGLRVTVRRCIPLGANFRAPLYQTHLRAGRWDS